MDASAAERELRGPYGVLTQERDGLVVRRRPRPVLPKTWVGVVDASGSDAVQLAKEWESRALRPMSSVALEVTCHDKQDLERLPELLQGVAGVVVSVPAIWLVEPSAEEWQFAESVQRLRIVDEGLEGNDLLRAGERYAGLEAEGLLVEVELRHDYPSDLLSRVEFWSTAGRASPVHLSAVGDGGMSQDDRVEEYLRAGALLGNAVLRSEPFRSILAPMLEEREYLHAAPASAARWTLRRERCPACPWRAFCLVTRVGPMLVDQDVAMECALRKAVLASCLTARAAEGERERSASARSSEKWRDYLLV